LPGDKLAPFTPEPFDCSISDRIRAVASGAFDASRASKLAFIEVNLRCDQLNSYNLKPADQGEELLLQGRRAH
jgi:hypothetical protein